MNRFLSPSPLRLSEGVAVVRIIVGFLLVYHGIEVFNPQLMKEYMSWDTFKGPLSKLVVYFGKSSELIAGISLSLGLLTRAGAVMTICIFTYITFFVGTGKFWYEDQHPFMFALFGLMFLFAGPGAWSVDGKIFRIKTLPK